MISATRSVADIVHERLSKHSEEHISARHETKMIEKFLVTNRCIKNDLNMKILSGIFKSHLWTYAELGKYPNPKVLQDKDNLYGYFVKTDPIASAFFMLISNLYVPAKFESWVIHLVNIVPGLGDYLENHKLK